jgi:hypothetical protein
MTPPKDCFAVLTPFQTEPHYSTYLSLFGRDLRAGETASARSRLVITPQIPDAQINALYESYVRP